MIAERLNYNVEQTAVLFQLFKTESLDVLVPCQSFPSPADPTNWGLQTVIDET